jgi:TRAP transporter 4TM/12TM fusion protein
MSNDKTLDIENTQEKIIVSKHRKLNKYLNLILMFFVIFGVLKTVDFIFDWRLFGLVESEISHYYLLMAMFISPVFLVFPPAKNLKGDIDHLLFYLDIILFLTFFGICIYLSTLGFDIIINGWSEIAPTYAVVLSIIMWLLILEAVRRTVGMVLLVAIMIFSLYPVYAEFMPAFLQGIGRSFNMTMTFHIYSLDGTVGLMMTIFANIVIGFITFGTLMDFSGAGNFFLDIANSIAGGTRGGPAKVSIIGSAFFGSLSGSVISNVLTTGTITIPTMKKSGYPAHYAAAIECCASTGGAIAPPVMGAVAFIMASFLGVSYIYVVLAAIVPTFLFYFGLFVQTDAYSAKNNLLGMKRDKIKPLLSVLKEGWYYLPSIIVLVYVLFFRRRVYQAPWIASLVLIVFSQIDKNSRFNIKKFADFSKKLVGNLGNIGTIMAGIGMIVGALSITGIAVSLSREIIAFAGGNVIFMLILGAISSFILGMGMPIVACYVFLSIVLAPALVEIGLDRMAAHLFVLYCGLWSFITPPVALATFPASILSGESPTKIAFTACRLGGVIFIIPFFFVLDPTLILKGDIGNILLSVTTATIGVFLLGSAFEGYMIGIGLLWDKISKLLKYIFRFLLAVSGIFLMYPGFYSDILGITIAIVVLFSSIFKKKQLITY